MTGIILNMVLNLASKTAEMQKLLRGKAARLVVVLLCFWGSPVQAETPVAVELLLALDASASMDAREFDLQVKGLAAAFRDPAVLEAIKNLGPLGAAIGVSQWGDDNEARLLVPFQHISSTRDAKAFGFRIGRMRRALHASSTSIASAIIEGMMMMEKNDFSGDRKVIDVSGDGKHNGMSDLEEARRAAGRQGYVVNGLPIDEDAIELSDYYFTNVIIGVDSFVEPAAGFADYARAIREKLLRELRPLAS